MSLLFFLPFHLFSLCLMYAPTCLSVGMVCMWNINAFWTQVHLRVDSSGDLSTIQVIMLTTADIASRKF